jgi:phage nucleotide-binding protein
MKQVLKLSQAPIEATNALIYGPPGVGKTPFACSSKKRRAFVIDVDQGLASANPRWGVDTNMIDYVTVESYDEFLWALDQYIKNYQKYEILVIDTVTELFRVLLDETRKKGRATQVPEQRDWGIVLVAFDDLIRAIRKLPGVKIFLGHEDSFDNKETGMKEIKPAFQGQTKKFYSKHFDVIARLFLVNAQVANADGTISNQVARYLQCQPTPNIDSRDKYGILGMYEIPDLDQILDRIDQGRNK